MKNFMITISCLLAPAAWGCATCFGDADSPQTQGMNMGILTLLAVTGTVVGFMSVVTVAILLRMHRATTPADEDAGEATNLYRCAWYSFEHS